MANVVGTCQTPLPQIETLPENKYGLGPYDQSHSINLWYLKARYVAILVIDNDMWSIDIDQLKEKYWKEFIPTVKIFHDCRMWMMSKLLTF